MGANNTDQKVKIYNYTKLQSKNLRINLRNDIHSNLKNLTTTKK